MKTTYFSILLLLIASAITVSCNKKPTILRYKKCDWIQSRHYTDTNTLVINSNTNSEAISYLEIVDNGRGFSEVRLFSRSSFSATVKKECQIQSIEGHKADLTPCLTNETCFGLECGDTICIAPWNGDTVRITGWGWNPDPLWTGTSCNEVHLYLYEEESYEY